MLVAFPGCGEEVSSLFETGILLEMGLVVSLLGIGRSLEMGAVLLCAAEFAVPNPLDVGAEMMLGAADVGMFPADALVVLEAIAVLSALESWKMLRVRVAVLRISLVRTITATELVDVVMVSDACGAIMVVWSVDGRVVVSLRLLAAVSVPKAADNTDSAFMVVELAASAVVELAACTVDGLVVSATEELASSTVAELDASAVVELATCTVVELPASTVVPPTTPCVDTGWVYV